MAEYKATILWHDLWIDGPMVGVCKYNGEYVIYARNRDGKYDLRRFKEDGYKKAERHHSAYRAEHGGHRDHDPKLFSPHKFDAASNTFITKTFDYVGNGINEIIATLESSDFEWFHPPKQHTPFSFNRPEGFDPEKVDGTDMQDCESDSDDESD